MASDPGAEAHAALVHLQALLRLGRLARAAAGSASGHEPAFDLAAALREAPPELEAGPDD
ncbi:MAG TPA: hypothetical protein VIR38_13330 [Thalassobaculum sp.]